MKGLTNKKKIVLSVLIIICIIMVAYVGIWIDTNYYHPLQLSTEIVTSQTGVSITVYFFKMDAWASDAYGNLTIQIEDTNGSILWRINNIYIDGMWSTGYGINWSEMNPEPNYSQQLIVRCWFEPDYCHSQKEMYVYRQFSRPPV